MDTVPVEFVTKTKLPRFNEETKRTETDTFEVGDRAELPPIEAGFVLGNGWAREVSRDA